MQSSLFKRSIQNSTNYLRAPRLQGVQAAQFHNVQMRQAASFHEQ